MRERRLLYIFTTIFLLGSVLVISMQYITSRNVNELVAGNQKLLNEMEVSSQLTRLQQDMLVFDNKLKTAVITSDSVKIKDFGKGSAEIETDIAALESIKTSDSIETYISILNGLVHQKMEFSNRVAESFYREGKPAAEKLFSMGLGTHLSESILLLAQKIDSSRQSALSKATIAMDNSGQRAFTWGFVLIIVVLILFTFLFCFIITRMKRQYELIDQLNASEKKIMEMVKVKDNFLANMSHEIRTPMNAILGYSNLLKRKLQDPEAILHLSTIQRSGENLLSIINDILDISKIEAGMMRIEQVPFGLRGLLHSVEVLLRHRAEEKGLTMDMRIAENIPDNLIGDPTRLTQVLVNILGNAIKFTEKGTVSLAVTSFNKDNHTADVHFTITDTGIGIEPDNLEIIFERFMQAEASTNRKYGGTGLGLSIAKNIIQVQQGVISISSTKDVGTNVSFHIPYKLSFTGTDEESKKLDALFTPFSSVVRVLVAEDNSINQTLLAHLFTDWRVSYYMVNNGKEAVEQLAQRKFDLVLMDLQMPEVDGYTATRLIREELKLTVPIFAMTAHAMAGEHEKCLRYGMNGHIFKPVQEPALYELISRYTQPATVSYPTINLDYLKEISNGNRQYEQQVTGAFILQAPKETAALQKAFEDGDYRTVKQIAHNLKTTISVMGLNSLLDEHLAAIEYFTEEGMQQTSKGHIESITRIVGKAVEEARSVVPAKG